MTSYAIDGTPDSNLMLTKSFIYSKKQNFRKLSVGKYEIDLLWIFILGGLIIIGVIIALIICCCQNDDKKKDGEDNKDKNEEQNKDKEPEGDKPADPEANKE